MPATVRKIAKNILHAALALAGTSVVVWALLPLAPGDVAERVAISRGSNEPTSEEIESVRRELGLDRLLVVQYFGWAARAATGDLSDSFRTRKPVMRELITRLPATAMLAAAALIVAIPFALLLGIAAAYFDGRAPDRAIRLLIQAGGSMPAFLLGLLMLRFVVVGLGLGHVIPVSNVGDVWLPAICLGFGRALDWAQILRTKLLESMGAMYVEVVRARGASRARMLVAYALPNSLLPFITVIGIGTGSLIGGAAVIETVFSWNGLGAFAVEAVAARDLPVVQGFALFATFAYVSAGLLADAAGSLIDPRLRRSA